MTELLSKGIVFKYFGGGTAPLVIGIIVSLAAGYFLGSLNFGIIISKMFYGDDIRKYGSKNAGMTNMLRTYGKKAAVVTFLGDALKTVAAALIGILVLGFAPYGFYGNYIGALGSVIGHVFPCYYKFKGGKGVVAAAAMILCTEPIVFVCLLVIFVGLVWATKIISVASIMGMLIYPLMLYRFTGGGFNVLIALALAVFIIVLHRENIKRLMNGTENKLSFGKKKESKTSKEK